MEYSDKIMKHFLTPLNVGEIENTDGVGRIEEAGCGDFLKVWIVVCNQHLKEVKYKVMGCPAAIAVCSMMSELATGIHIDQALYFRTGKGLVIIAGCAHSGIVNILDYIATLTGEKQIHAVLGGIHLNSASNDRIERTINAFRRYNVRQIGLAHCTGGNAVAKFRDAFGERCVSCSVGNQIGF